MTTTSEPLADQGPCRTCDCVQWDHKRGKGGCKACGTCDKYKPPKVHPKSAPARALAELTRESIELGTYDLAVPADEPPAGPQPADDLARVTLPAAEVDQLRVEQLAGDLANAQATIAWLTVDLARANAARARAQHQLDEAIRASVTAAANVLWRYDARQCETCGARYTAHGVEHEHPLTPVTVLVVRRDVPGAIQEARADALAQMKENNE